MIEPPERSPERDAALDALVAVRPFPGWTVRALQEAAGPDADLLFPGGPLDMIEAHSDLADRRMVEAAEAGPVPARTHERVRELIALRLRQTAPAKDAVRRALGRLAGSADVRRLAAVQGRTVDAIWWAAGDRSADFSWYTKRALLGGVYAATLLFWLRDDSEDDAASLAFLDRRLEGVARIGRLRGRFSRKGPKT